MNTLRIFVASSTEGKKIATAFHTRLQDALNAAKISAKVEMWMHKFDLSRTAIESLEIVANEADFAVVVMTPDDIKVIRRTREATPRDNLVFELGLFIGALGRDRAIVIRKTAEKSKGAAGDLKLPSDILGMMVLSYEAKSPKTLKASIQTACDSLIRQIRDRGPRPKWLAEGRALLASNRTFYRQIEGAWWERINQPAGSALSYFTITADALGNVEFEGISFDEDGKPRAKWKSEMARLYPSDRKVVYLWRGRHPLPGYANFDFHGYGTMEFEQPDEASRMFTQGSGEFWDVDESHPQNTVIKSIELHRVQEEEHKKIMARGTAKKKSALALKVIKNW